MHNKNTAVYITGHAVLAAWQQYTAILKSEANIQQNFTQMLK